MAKCVRCGTNFGVTDAQGEYNAVFNGDPDYDEIYGGEVCGSCAISDSETLINQGRAIDMMNGEEVYDDDFVQEWL